MPAYWVARSKITDPVEYKKYTDRVPAIIAKFGGKVLARGGRFEIMEGPDKFHRFVVIEFPSFEQGVACFQVRRIQRGGGIPARRRGRGRNHHGGCRRRDEVRSIKLERGQEIAAQQRQSVVRLPLARGLEYA